MDTLLQNVFDAYGGLDRWRGLTTLTARITYGGPFWELKAVPILWAQTGWKPTCRRSGSAPIRNPAV
jgi:hypothetical protein